MICFEYPMKVPMAYVSSTTWASSKCWRSSASASSRPGPVPPPRTMSAQASAALVAGGSPLFR